MEKLTTQKGDTTWFKHDRFGMFIHWGLYALPARHEWIKNIERIKDEKYDEYFRHFDPDLFDPAIWAKAAKYAGMKYFVITAKHHDGFCLWDSKYTDYKAPNTRAKRDLLAPIIEAFRAEGIKIGLYYSLLDWHHPEYTMDGTHPQCLDENYVKAAESRNIDKYTEYLHNQVDELLTQYGKIDIIWFDFSFDGNDEFFGHNPGKFKGKGKNEWQSVKLINKIRSIFPDIIINDRLQIPQDTITPEQVRVSSPIIVEGKPVTWETCQTLSGSWGYYRDEETWKSVETLVKMLIETVSADGNLILNVGPTARGYLDDRALDRLLGMGDWMKYNSRSIYGCTATPCDIKCPQDCRLTYNHDTNRLYLHIFSWPFKTLYFEGIGDKIEYAQLLNDASEILYKVNGNDLTIELPVKKPNVAIPVIEIFLK